MATPLGGNAPKPKRSNLPSMLALPKPKADAPTAAPTPDEADTPDTPPSGGSVKAQAAMKPGKAMFHNQTQTCASCEYFDPAGNGGQGECKMGVPEADFSTSDPDASHCVFYEGNDDATESPDDESSEEAAEPVEAS